MATFITPFGDQPAFPCGVPVAKYDDGQTRRTASGITVRDWFAAQAMAGLLAYNPGPAEDEVEQYDADRAAEDAYRFADEMLKAREAKVAAPPL